jgi:hypothetical protein
MSSSTPERSALSRLEQRLMSAVTARESGTRVADAPDEPSEA